MPETTPATTPENKPEKRNYKATLNLPQTAFPMKANLVQNEPATLKRWQEMGLYQQVRKARKGSPVYAFHDGPPYANGSIHLGHLLNKVLKDFVVRSRTMAGMDCPYVPGWDCHGLPIEHKVVQELGDKARTMEPLHVRRKCQTYAEKFVKLQSGQMQRLLTLADYANPYLTMDPAYEAGTLEVFASLVAQGLVYRALKPVHWSIANQTALAEAELEYEDRQDTSVYVLFELEGGRGISDLGFGIWALAEGARPASGHSSTGSGLPAGAPVFLMIWTTTPWTLPANLAVAVHENYQYGLYRFEHEGKPAGVIVATDLAGKVLPLGGAQAGAPLATWTGAQLTAARYHHPFIERTSPVVTADYVTLEDGTGLVHTAPGHGVEDYQTGLREKIQFSPDRRRVLTRSSPGAADRADTYCPVLGDGRFDETAPDWLRGGGVDVWKANDLVIDRLKASAHLFHAHAFTHSYPHDWRSKTPVIFRATEQWFVSVDKALADGSFTPTPPPTEAGAAAAANAGTAEGTLRQRAIAAADVVKFYPDWGRNRLRGMLESRPDWCISRQRSWGLPIPAFFAADKHDYLLTAASVRAVAAAIGKLGSDYWFKATAAELLAGYDPAADPDAPPWVRAAAASTGLGDLVKSTDIFDVWFDSGTSWNSVIRQRFGDGYFPTDLYLEGSDQHRGWFQASLLPALGMTGRPPYKAVLTHGFMVDKDGRKMSKSLGNALEVDTLLKDHGADVCRWWVSSINTDNDIKVDPSFFQLAGEEYRKIRNTIKYLLSNLYDFKPDAAYVVTAADAASPDAWALAEFSALVDQVRGGYQEFAYRATHEAIFNFCNETLSAVYLAATKDRMYCDRPDSPRRRRAQSAMFHMVDGLIRLLAPILPHTADEAWRSLHGAGAGAGAGQAPSVHLETFPESQPTVADPAWPEVIALRGQILKTVEEFRKSSGVENPLDLGVRLTLAATRKEAEFVTRFSPTDLADICGISRVEVVRGGAGDRAVTIEAVDLRGEPRCDRSWKRDGTVKQRSDGGMLSDRDAEAVGVA